MRLRTPSSAIATGSMAASSRADCAPWHPGQAHRTSLALAEWLCRTADRIDPARVCGPHHCLGRDAFASGPEILRRLLQSCFITPIRLYDWREEVLLIWMRSRGGIWVLPRAMNDALGRRFAGR